MAKRDRLGRLQMRKARHDIAHMRLCLAHENALQSRQHARRLGQGTARPEAEIGHDLVIARACCVQPSGRLADNLLQPRLDIHVYVFKLDPVWERPIAHLGANLVEPGLNRLIIRS